MHAHSDADAYILKLRIFAHKYLDGYFWAASYMLLVH